MQKRILTAFAIMAVSAGALIAATVKGRILDAQGQPLVGATATLLSLPDSTIVGGSMADAEGFFTFTKLKPNHYGLKASMTGMDTESTDFTIADTTKLLTLPPLKLYEESTVLTDLVVKGVKAAVVAKEDTIEFNADSFHTTDNAVVEDLLKKLPGVEVGSDGAITSNGKTVSKILVNGKEFFSDDPKMASKNLSAKAISKVQVLDRKSDQARLTGVDDGEDETVINLTFKKGMEESWFGNAKAGYGTDGRYTAGFAITRMAGNTQLTLTGNANNVNEQAFGQMGRGAFGGGGGGIKNTQMLGLNFTTGADEKFVIGGDIRYMHSIQNVESKQETMNLLPDSVSYQNSNSKSKTKQHGVDANLRMKWEINPDNTLDFRPRFSYATNYVGSGSLSELFAGDPARTKVNRQANDRIDDADNWSVSGDLTYVHRFPQKKGRSLSLNAQYSFTKKDSHATTLSEIVRYLLSEDSQDEDLFRFTDNKTWNNNVSARVTWTEPIGREGNFIEFAYRFQTKRNNSDKYTYNLPMSLLTGTPGDYLLPDFAGVPEGAEFSDVLSNSFRNDFLTQSIRAGYVRTTKEMNLNAGIELTPSSSKSINLIQSERTIPRRNVLNFAPYFRLRYKLSKQRSINVRYNARSSQPSMTQLQPVADVTNPMNIKVGNPDLKPTFTQRLHAMFSDFNMDTQRSVFAMVNGSYTINNIISKTTTDPTTGARTTTYTNTSGNWDMMAMGMLNQPLRNRNWRVFGHLMARYNTYNSYINEQFNRSGNFSIGPRAGITFSTEIVQISANPNYSWQLATNTLANQQNRRNSRYGFDTDFTLTLPFGLQMGTNLHFSKQDGLSAGYDAESWVWNANIQYVIPHTYGLSIFAEAHDILADVKTISRSVSSAAISDSWSNNLSRYFMFGLSWRFNSATMKKKTGTDADDMPMPGPGGPGGPGGRGGGRPGGFGGGRPF